MALFDIFKKDKKKKVEEKLKRPPKGALKSSLSTAKSKARETKKEEKESGIKEGKSEFAATVILAPHVTEKSANFAERGVYVFRVVPAANKVMIKRAVKELYGFAPARIRITNMPAKARIVRGKKGVKSAYKKAMVYLKAGDKIDLS